MKLTMLESDLSHWPAGYRLNAQLEQQVLSCETLRLEKRQDTETTSGGLLFFVHLKIAWFLINY